MQVVATPVGQTNCFVQWRNAASGSQNPLNLNVTAANSTITGIFTALPTNKVSLTVFSEGGGFVDVIPSGNIFLKGTTNILTAYASSGQSFIGWSGDVTNTFSIVSVKMNTNKFITAHFSHSFSQNFSKSGTNLQFVINGVSGDTFKILASTNLSSWKPIGTNVQFLNPVIFSDSVDKKIPARFYKVTAQ